MHYAGGCPVLTARHVNPKISPVVRILPAPWGLSGGNWWLPLSHRVVGAPDPPSVTSVSVQETTSSFCVHGGGVPRRVRGAVQKSSPPPLRPRAPFHNPPGAALCGGCFSRRPRAPLALPAASPIIAIQTWRIGEAWSGPYDRTDCMMVLSPKSSHAGQIGESEWHTRSSQQIVLEWGEIKYSGCMRVCSCYRGGCAVGKLRDVPLAIVRDQGR
jgi:hypothetical protein